MLGREPPYYAGYPPYYAGYLPTMVYTILHPPGYTSSLPVVCRTAAAGR